MTRQISLLVNEVPIELDYFVQGFIDHTTAGMLAALEGTGEIGILELTIVGDQVTINLNNTLIPTNAFASKIIRNTINGMVSPLKGVNEIKRVKIRLSR